MTPDLGRSPGFLPVVDLEFRKAQTLLESAGQPRPFPLPPGLPPEWEVKLLLASAFQGDGGAMGTFPVFTSPSLCRAFMLALCWGGWRAASEAWLWGNSSPSGGAPSWAVVGDRVQPEGAGLGAWTGDSCPDSPAP